eukprot:scaffold1601_cov57-Phaeocystis_antarctica.AAC.3
MQARFRAWPSVGAYAVDDDGADTLLVSFSAAPGNNPLYVISALREGRRRYEVLAQVSIETQVVVPYDRSLQMIKVRCGREESAPRRLQHQTLRN